MVLVAVFVFGLVVGSFLNAVLYRLPLGESLLDRHSHCPDCRHRLTWKDLIPLVSFFVLGRRCRYCKKQISWQYPMVELATGAAFALVAVNFSAEGGSAYGGQFWFQIVFVSFLIVIFVYDLKHYLILDKVVIPAAILAGVYQIIQGRFSDAVFGALLLSGFFAALYFFSKGRWIGAGDMKLGIFLGILVPYPETLVLFLLAYLIGAAAALTLVAAGRKKMADRLPFGTFLTLAAFIAMLWGEEIVQWYFKLPGIK